LITEDCATAIKLSSRPFAIEVALVERLRGEEKFDGLDGLDALVAQMNDDVARARATFVSSGRCLSVLDRDAFEKQAFAFEARDWQDGKAL
jgi:hypothetical protein